MQSWQSWDAGAVQTDEDAVEAMLLGSLETMYSQDREMDVHMGLLRVLLQVLQRHGGWRGGGERVGWQASLPLHCTWRLSVAEQGSLCRSCGAMVAAAGCLARGTGLCELHC